jgi:hypothetical protein
MDEASEQEPGTQAQPANPLMLAALASLSQPTLVPEVTVVVHPVDVTVHLTYPPGWRWAIQVGGRPPTDLDYCAGAGHCPTESEASMAGEEAGSTATKALRMLGVPARYAYLRLGYDPMPAEADDRPLAVWHGGGE